jgi:phosphatidylglycerophosphate synthase
VRKAAAAGDDVAITTNGTFTGVCAMAKPALEPPAKTLEIGAVLAHEVTTPEARRAAEAALFRSLKKRTDGPISRLINRAVSTSITKLLVNTNVTPNQMTYVSTLVGAAGVLCVFQATWVYVAIGAFLVQMQSILDGCDGEIARLKFKSSKFGEWLDNVLDDQVNVAFGIAMGYAASVLLDNQLWLWLGVGSGIAFMIHNTLFYAQLAFVHRSGNPFNFRWWFERGKDVTAMLENTSFVSRIGAFVRALVRRDVFLFGFFLLAVARLPQVAVVWYAAVAASQFALISTHVAMGGMRRTT